MLTKDGNMKRVSVITVILILALSVIGCTQSPQPYTPRYTADQVVYIAQAQYPVAYSVKTTIFSPAPESMNPSQPWPWLTPEQREVISGLSGLEKERQALLMAAENMRAFELEEQLKEQFPEFKEQKEREILARQQVITDTQQTPTSITATYIDTAVWEVTIKAPPLYYLERPLSGVSSKTLYFYETDGSLYKTYDRYTKTLTR
ncbi:MAG: hypothetical protein Q8O55_00965 [Dehalococcoidales bacterium]|nr:hypothetical protein [Dehalococcoidales bacterium]